MTNPDAVLRDYRSAYIMDFGDDPPIMAPDEGGFVMNDDIFPCYHTFFSFNEVKQMTGWMRQRIASRAINCDTW